MSPVIFPRSPTETMAGWVYLPRFIDKIRLHLAGKLAPEYQSNFTKGFDAAWLKAAGLSAEEFIAMVKGTISDGEICDWVRVNVKTPEAAKKAFGEEILNRGRNDEQARVRLAERKQQLGLAARDDVQTFVQLIDADEKRI